MVTESYERTMSSRESFFPPTRTPSAEKSSQQGAGGAISSGAIGGETSGTTTPFANGTTGGVSSMPTSFMGQHAAFASSSGGPTTTDLPGTANVEALFKTKPLSTIRFEHREQMKKLSAKKKELRQLVGGQYRQVLASTDLCRQIQDSAEKFRGLIIELEHLQTSSISSNLLRVEKGKLNQLIAAPLRRSGVAGSAEQRRAAEAGAGAAGVVPGVAGVEGVMGGPAVLVGADGMRTAGGCVASEEEGVVGGASVFAGADCSTAELYKYTKKVKQLLELPQLVRQRLLRNQFLEAAEQVLTILPSLQKEISEHELYRTTANRSPRPAALDGTVGGGGEDYHITAERTRPYRALLSAQELLPSASPVAPLAAELSAACARSFSKSALAPAAFAEALACLLFLQRSSLPELLEKFLVQRLVLGRRGGGVGVGDAIVCCESTFLCLHHGFAHAVSHVKPLVENLQKFASSAAAVHHLPLLNSSPELDRLLASAIVAQTLPAVKEKLVLTFFPVRYQFPSCSTLKEVFTVSETAAEDCWNQRLLTEDYKTIWPTLNLPDCLSDLRERATAEMSQLLEARVLRIATPTTLESLETQLKAIVADIRSLPVQYAQDQSLLKKYSDSLYQRFASLLDPDSATTSGTTTITGLTGGTHSQQLADQIASQSLGGKKSAAILDAGHVTLSGQGGAELALDLYRILQWGRGRDDRQAPVNLSQDYLLVEQTSERLLNLLEAAGGNLLKSWLRDTVGYEKYRKQNPEVVSDPTDLVASQLWGTLKEGGGQIVVGAGALGGAKKYYLPLAGSSHLVGYLVNCLTRKITTLFGDFLVVPPEAARVVQEVLTSDMLPLFLDRREQLQQSAAGAMRGGAKEGTRNEEAEFLHKLQFFFDLKLLGKLLQGEEVATQLSHQAVFPDPVDQLLYGPALEAAVTDFLQSTNVLLSPLFPHLERGGESSSPDSTTTVSTEASLPFTKPDYDPPLCSHAMRFPLLPIAGGPPRGGSTNPALQGGGPNGGGAKPKQMFGAVGAGVRQSLQGMLWKQSS